MYGKSTRDEFLREVPFIIPSEYQEDLEAALEQVAFAIIAAGNSRAR